MNPWHDTNQRRMRRDAHKRFLTGALTALAVLAGSLATIHVAHKAMSQAVYDSIRLEAN